MELVINPGTITRRLRRHGVDVASSKLVIPGMVEVTIVGPGEGHARRAAHLLLQDGYDVARRGNTVRVTLPESEEDRAAWAARNAEQGRIAAELADPTSEAGKRLDAALTAMNPAAGVIRSSSPTHGVLIGELVVAGRSGGCATCPEYIDPGDLIKPLADGSGYACTRCAGTR